MERRRRRSPTVAAGAAVAIIALFKVSLPAFGQDAEGGMLFTLGLSTTLAASDNADLDLDPAGGTIQSETTFTLGFESVTRTQALRFALSDTIRAGDGPGAQQGLRGPTVALSYQKEAANARFDISARLDTRDIDGELVEEDLDDLDALIVDRGTLTTANLDVGLETGLRGPFGMAFSLSETRRNYSGITDPDLEDSRSRSGTAALVFRPDPTTETRLTFGITEFEQEDAVGTERTTRSLSLDARRQVDPTTTITASLGWTRITEAQTAVSLTLPEDSGFTASFGYLRDLPAGRFSTDLSRSITNAGGRIDLAATRVFEMPASTFEVSLGATLPEDTGVEPTVRIAYSRALQDQRIELGLSSDVAVTSDGEVLRRTTAGINYGLEINSRDSLGFGLDFSKVTGIDGSSAIERTSASATASYSRLLTTDWTLSAGLTHRLSREAGVGTATSNRAFVTLGREFSWRP